MASMDDDKNPLLKTQQTVDNDDDDLDSNPNRSSAALTFCDPRRWFHRWMLLPMICLLSTGSYYAYDMPAALEDHIEQDMNVNTSQYALLYALYSWPNVILSFFGGFLIDRVFGVQIGAIVFAGFVLAGQAIFALGASVNKFWVMELGRFVFGMGGESLAVAQNSYCVRWFKGRELNMVFGIQLSISRVGSTVNLQASGPIYDDLSNASPDAPGYTVLGWTLWVGAAVCVLSLILAILLCIMDRRSEKVIKRDLVTKESDKIQLRDLLHFPLRLWLIFFICVCYYVAVFPFIALGQLFFENKYDMGQAQANTANSLVYLISAGASPVCGFAVDYFGRNLFFVIGAIVGTLGAHVLMAFTFLTPFVPMALLGVSYSFLASSLWPLVSYVVPEHQLGTAYGIMQSVQNLGLAVVAQGAGVIADEKGYLWLELFFIICVSLSLFFSCWLYLLDAGNKGNLNYTRAQRKAEADGKQIEEEDLKAK